MLLTSMSTFQDLVITHVFEKSRYNANFFFYVNHILRVGGSVFEPLIFLG